VRAAVVVVSDVVLYSVVNSRPEPSDLNPCKLIAVDGIVVGGVAGAAQKGYSFSPSVAGIGVILVVIEKVVVERITVTLVDDDPGPIVIDFGVPDGVVWPGIGDLHSFAAVSTRDETKRTPMVIKFASI